MDARATQAGNTPGTPWLATLGWAAYLACSWTWCIGMFLPVLLVRDYGVWGFVVFAVPNVIGAGAMGWVLTRKDAAHILARHEWATLWFSCVTIVFQLFFLGWLGDMGGAPDGSEEALRSGRMAPWWTIVGAYLAIGVLGWLARRVRSSTPVSVAIWCCSAAIGAVLLSRGGLDFRGAVMERPLAGHEMGAVWLAPVCAFGFLLCPYLDLTFLRVCHEQPPRVARGAFTLGFGVMFFAMILLTLGYATDWTPMSRGARMPRPVPLAINLVSLHIVTQLLYTCGVHLFAAARKLGERKHLASLLLLATVVPLAILVWGWRSIPAHSGLTGPEVVYRCFMSFYGLVFPAYVWICMIPTADGHSGLDGAPGRRKLAVLAAACVLAAPCYWMGFIERREWWLAPGLGIVLLARLIVRGRPAGEVRPL